MDWRFDKRIVERNIHKGIVSAKDYDKHLKTLTDLAGQVAPIVEDRTEKATAEEPRPHEE